MLDIDNCDFFSMFKMLCTFEKYFHNHVHKIDILVQKVWINVL